MGLLNLLKSYDFLNSKLCLFTIISIPLLVAAATAPKNIHENPSLPDGISSDSINTSPPVPEQLPFCGDHDDRTLSHRLIYVTTLDGKLTALNVLKSGQKQWTVETGPGPLVSSSIHRLELTNNGKFVRMIPSLSGGIYKFDGETIEPIPLTADNLLSNSLKFSEDLIISGGKETRSYGISARTGQVLYECSIKGCLNHTEIYNNNEKVNRPALEEVYIEHDPLLDDVVLIRRQTQTVRAIEPRTGSERWNFSVGHHELELLRSTECHARDLNDLDLAKLMDLEVKVVVPEGIICAFSKANPNKMLWKYKFDHPIVSAWQIDANDKVKHIDLFQSAQWFWSTENGGKLDKDKDSSIFPSVYLGMYHKQLYIQESGNLQKLILERIRQFNYEIVSSESLLPGIPWKPLAATSSALLLLDTDLNNKDFHHNRDVSVHHTGNSDDSDEDDSVDTPSVTALSVLYASEYVNGNGFFLYTSDDLNKTNQALCEKGSVLNSTETNETNFTFDFNPDESTVQFIVFSMLFWWKEIFAISLTTAILLRLILPPAIGREHQIVYIERHIPVETGVIATEESISRSTRSQRSLSESNSAISQMNFTSRFQGDFDLIQCLGKGGFGVVFEAKNKLDDCNYAVKRITLPNRKESRDRVMREVKTLANCEHQNIVRYFQAWVETPPPGWQEAEDMKWIDRANLSTSIQIETPDGTTLPSLPISPSNWTSSGNFSKSEPFKPKLSNINSTDYSDIIGLNYLKNVSFKKNKIDTDDDDDSFIEFRDETSEENKSASKHFPHEQNGFTSEIDGLDGNIQIDDESDSLEIEFREPSVSDHCANSKSNIHHENPRESNNFSHSRRRRPVSLSLSCTSKDHVVLPVSVNEKSSTQNKVYLYIQMQLCRKQSLKDWLKQNKLDMRQPHIKNIFEQIVGAVEYVHAKGLIHRDLKPGNIFFSLDGQIKIGDFGLVTDMSNIPNFINLSSEKNGLSPPLKHTQLVGTHLYMSPEQLEGKSYNYKVDIFSLGLIFFELLVYFETEMERIITLRALRDGSFPNEFVASSPREFDLLKLMLSKIPSERPPTFKIKEKLNLISPWLASTSDLEK